MAFFVNDGEPAEPISPADEMRALIERHRAFAASVEKAHSGPFSINAALKQSSAIRAHARATEWEIDWWLRVWDQGHDRWFN
jgi:hypothetical protein